MTQTVINLITEEQVREKALELIKRHPRKTNPHLKDKNLCIYSTPDRKRHCFVGQLFINFGLPCPDCSVILPCNSLPQIKNFTLDAQLLLEKLQRAADTPQKLPNLKRVEWRTLKSLIV